MKKQIFIYVFFICAFPSFSQTVILSSDFTSASGWSGWNIDNNYFSHYFTIPPHGSIAYLCEGDGNDSYYQVKLVSPQMNLSSYSSAYVALSVYFFRQTYGGQTESLQILASTNGGSTWTQVRNIQGSTNWHREYADISAYCGNANVKIALQYSDNNGWLYGAGVDDVLVCTMQSNDAALMKINKQDFWQVNQPYPIKLLLQNYGTDTITSAVVNYSVDGGTTQTDNITGLNLAPLDTQSFVHSVPWIPPAGGHNVTVWIESVNGLSDQNNSNDTLSFILRNTVSSVPQKKILADWMTASWCTLCPHGNAIIDSIIEDHPGVVIPVNMHEIYMGPDPIFDSIYSGTNYPYTYAMDDYYNSCPNDAGWLSRGYIDKYDFEDVYGKCVERLEVTEMAEERLAYVSPASITASFTMDTLNRIIDANLTAVFFSNLQGDFRFNGLVLKDSISFNQDNWFTIPNRWPYCSSLSSIPYVHNHILIQSFGGRNGTDGSIPSAVTDGNSYTWHYTDTLKDQMISTDHLSLVFMVMEYDSVASNSVVLNSVVLPADTSATGIYPQEGYNGFNVYPNPVSDEVYIIHNSDEEILLSFSDVQGKLLFSYKGVLPANYKIDISKFKAGIYILRMSDIGNNHSAIAKIVKL